ncbi:Tat pathway signal protein [Lentibacter sp.]|uniref:Tat pathway signal protein n=1 Tax=Lentibacter sp. TaxID=2024994 RepID=UPI003F6D7C6C
MPHLTRRGFIGTALAAGTARAVPTVASKAATRRILTLVYDKSLGMMRAVEKIVPLR